jgi:shikimate dehydrogenase
VNQAGLRIVALFGSGAVGRPLPAMYNAAFAAAGLKWSYIPFRANADTLAELFGRLRDDNMVGAEFDPPCQEVAASLCDELSPEAGRLRAVTTLRFRDGKAEGFNMDALAFPAVLDELACDVNGKAALVLGVGPRGRAAGLALEGLGAAVTFGAEDLSAARPGVTTQAAVIRLADAPIYLKEKRPALVVNALGESAAVRFDVGDLPESVFVLDFNVCPGAPLYDSARQRGLPAADGLPILLHRGRRAFELWTGIDAPGDVMLRAAKREVENMGR